MRNALSAVERISGSHGDGVARNTLAIDGIIARMKPEERHQYNLKLRGTTAMLQRREDRT